MHCKLVELANLANLANLSKLFICTAQIMSGQTSPSSPSSPSRSSSSPSPTNPANPANPAKLVIGLCGLSGHGKDTVADFLVEQGFKRVSFAGLLKDIVGVLFSWDRDMLEGRTPESREFREQVDPYWSAKLGMPGLTSRKVLQLWGTEVVRQGWHADMWMLALERQIQTSRHDKFVITDCRFENEMQMVKRLGGQIWHVQRSVPAWQAQLCQIANQPNQSNQPAHPAQIEQQCQLIPNLPHMSEWAFLLHANLIDRTIDNTGSLDELRKQTFIS